MLLLDSLCVSFMNQDSQTCDQSESGVKQGAVAVIKDGDKFLSIKRAQSVSFPGKICFPGGRVEPGETVEQALVREMQEELGIAVRPVRLIWKSISARGFELNWCTAEIKTGEVVSPDQSEVESFEWLTQSEMMANPDLLSSNGDFFEALQRCEFEI